MKIPHSLVFAAVIWLFAGLIAGNGLSLTESVAGLILFSMLYLTLYFMLPKAPLRPVRYIVSRFFGSNHKIEQHIFMTLDASNCYFQFYRVAEDVPDWKPCIVTVYPAYVRLKSNLLTIDESVSFNPVNVQWMGRSHPYDNINNEIWFDINEEGIWNVLGLRMHKSDMKVFEDELETLVSDYILLKRNRQRPNLRYGPIPTHALSKVSETWAIEETDLQLYVTPVSVVVMADSYVMHSIALDKIDDMRIISATLPGGIGSGILVFNASGKQYAYSLTNHEAFGDGGLSDYVHQLRL